MADNSERCPDHDMGDEIPDKNLFMMCGVINPDALSPLPNEYHVRPLKRDELDIWKRIHFDDAESAAENYASISKFYDDVYGGKEDLFYETCLFVCNGDDIPIGTCFAWKSYQSITTIHWFKVVRKYEGRGIGRALLSIVMNGIAAADYPVFLHTQPASYRAIKLYTDFGFALLTNPEIGFRRNDLEECMPILRAHMVRSGFDKLCFSEAPEFFLDAVKTSPFNQF